MLASRENEIYQSEHFLSFLSDLVQLVTNKTQNLFETNVFWIKTFDQFKKK